MLASQHWFWLQLPSHLRHFWSLVVLLGPQSLPDWDPQPAQMRRICENVRGCVRVHS